MLCLECSERLPALPERCYRCRKLSAEDRTCRTCRRSSGLYAVHVATVYDSAAKALVWGLKFDGAQAAAGETADLIRLSTPENTGLRTYIVPVPTASGRARRRGYDQAKLVARELARKTGFEYRDYLRRSGQAHQVGANRRERLSQLDGAFRVRFPLPREARILLVDDVVTTGATLEAAAKACRMAGASRVEAVVFAQP